MGVLQGPAGGQVQCSALQGAKWRGGAIQFYIGIKVTSFNFQSFLNSPSSPSPIAGHCRGRVEAGAGIWHFFSLMVLLGGVCNCHTIKKQFEEWRFNTCFVDMNLIHKWSYAWKGQWNDIWYLIYHWYLSWMKISLKGPIKLYFIRCPSHILFDLIYIESNLISNEHNLLIFQLNKQSNYILSAAFSNSLI